MSSVIAAPRQLASVTAEASSACDAALPAGALADPGVDVVLKRNQARMLYAHGVRGLVMTMAAGTILVVMVGTPGCLPRLLIWLGMLAAVLALRAADVRLWHPARLSRGDAWDGQAEIAFFAAGVVATALVWALFTPLLFPAISVEARIASAIVMAALASSSPMVLAPYLPLAMVYSAAQVIPPSLFFLSEPGRENQVIGVLGLIGLPAIILAGRPAHGCLLDALRLGHANAQLLMAAERQRREAEAVTCALTTAQVALQDANQCLERRIQERTAALAREVTDRNRYAEALARLVSTDELTGLATRSAFVEQLAGMLQAADETGTSVAVLFIDLDKFKQVNDVRGHATGDHLLRAVAALLGRHAGPDVHVARWGGDEFVMALPDAHASDVALALARRLRRGFSTPIQAGLDMLRMDCTIGIALYPQHATTHDELIRAADVAMYEGKKEGGGRIKLFDPALAHGVAERHMLEQALRDAIDNGDFSLVFQPIVSAETGRCEAFEALLRWAHPILGPISPSRFIPVAEQTGLIGAIGRWVLREACRAAAAWPGDAPPVTVNVSVEQVLSGTLLTDVEAALSASGLPVHRLQLEITESLFVTDKARVTTVIEALRTAGVRILMDDFGSGYSSLASLSSLPLDVIKIDKSFVQTDDDEHAFIKAILLIARSLHLRVVAEGIETEQQRALLSELGVELLQGYFFAHPMAESEIVPWLAGASNEGKRVLF
jgi:diguanylate cyclase (GGDEF)-like protein